MVDICELKSFVYLIKWRILREAAKWWKFCQGLLLQLENSDRLELLNDILHVSLAQGTVKLQVIKFRSQIKCHMYIGIGNGSIRNLMSHIFASPFGICCAYLIKTLERKGVAALSKFAWTSKLGHLATKQGFLTFNFQMSTNSKWMIIS